MTLETVKKSERVMGMKQVTKALIKDQVSWVFLGSDADEKITKPLKLLCTEKDIPLKCEYTMKELGKACSIEVGAAAVAILRQGNR